MNKRKWIFATAIGCAIVQGTHGNAFARADAALNKAVLAYAQAQLGAQIGDGECWTLANAALGAAGARQPGTGGLGTYEFGTVVVGQHAPGDILQFAAVEFHYADGSSQWFPQHTAVIETATGEKLGILSQNFNGNRTVQRQRIDLDAKTAGTITEYEPEAR